MVANLCRGQFCGKDCTTKTTPKNANRVPYVVPMSVVPQLLRGNILEVENSSASVKMVIKISVPGEVMKSLLVASKTKDFQKHLLSPDDSLFMVGSRRDAF